MTGIDEAIKISGDVLSKGGAYTIYLVLADNLPAMLILPIVVIAVLLAVIYADKKAGNKAFRVISLFAALSAAGGVMLIRYLPGSIAISYLALSFVMTAVVFILGFVKLTALDYGVMFACFTCVNRVVGLNTLFFGSALPVFFIFVVVFAVYGISAGRLNGQLFHAWFASMLTVLEAYFFNAVFNHYILPIGYVFNSDIKKLFVWALTSLAIVIVNIALIYVIKRLLGKYFDEVNDMGKSYPKIERFFIYNSAAILLLAMLFYFIYGLANWFFNMPNMAFNLFLAFAQAIQVSFLILIFRITRLKDNLQSKTLESESLASYSSSLEKNMDDIRGIKHDIKNIFITMGGFVERSGDEEMRDFFRESISPFVDGEIAKSDLFGKLASMDSEQLRAFFRYKISQATERGIAVDLDVSAVFPAPDTRVGLTDLVRILGILLDNAIEECMTLTQGMIAIRLTSSDEMDVFMIKNTVSLVRKETGVRAGISSKGDDRGKGLMIARSLLGKYDCATLNSYFKDDCFIQSLTLYHEFNIS